ncbi:hypothetical protein LTR66_007913 [Elasticomyces elasticus]|nr:hypothetical protein LTR66_007913 [Elasticomyces elasticus]KAK4987541.1 hypothetical protein LTR50_004574 [Elasticomyces elasticus]
MTRARHARETAVTCKLEDGTTTATNTAATTSTTLVGTKCRRVRLHVKPRPFYLGTIGDLIRKARARDALLAAAGHISPSKGPAHNKAPGRKTALKAVAKHRAGTTSSRASNSAALQRCHAMTLRSSPSSHASSAGDGSPLCLWSSIAGVDKHFAFDAPSSARAQGRVDSGVCSPDSKI